MTNHVEVKRIPDVVSLDECIKRVYYHLELYKDWINDREKERFSDMCYELGSLNRIVKEVEKTIALQKWKEREYTKMIRRSDRINNSWINAKD